MTDPIACTRAGRWGGSGSGWELGGSRERGQRGVCACVAGLAGGGLRAGGAGSALPCRLLLATEEGCGQEEGSWPPGRLGDEASQPNGGGRATRCPRWGDRSPGAPFTVRP